MTRWAPAPSPSRQAVRHPVLVRRQRLGAAAPCLHRGGSGRRARAARLRRLGWGRALGPHLRRAAQAPVPLRSVRVVLAARSLSELSHRVQWSREVDAARPEAPVRAEKIPGCNSGKVAARYRRL